MVGSGHCFACNRRVGSGHIGNLEARVAEIGPADKSELSITCIGTWHKTIFLPPAKWRHTIHVNVNSTITVQKQIIVHVSFQV